MRKNRQFLFPITIILLILALAACNQPPAGPETTDTTQADGVVTAPDTNQSQTEAPAADAGTNTEGATTTEGDAAALEGSAESAYPVTTEGEAPADGEAAPEGESPRPEGELAAEGANVEQIHTIQRGESLYAIADQYGVDWQVLADYNNITDPNAINFGDELRIPAAAGAETAEAGEATTESGEAAAPQDGPVTHIVQPGQSLGHIANLYADVSYLDIAEANGITDPDNVAIGTELIIPGQEAAPAPTDAESTEGEGEAPTTEGEAPATPEATTDEAQADSEEATEAAPDAASSGGYIVQQGDTLFLISLEYGVQWTDIAAANGLTAPYTVQAGDELIIPGQ